MSESKCPCGHPHKVFDVHVVPGFGIGTSLVKYQDRVLLSIMLGPILIDIAVWDLTIIK